MKDKKAVRHIKLLMALIIKTDTDKKGGTYLGGYAWICMLVYIPKIYIAPKIFEMLAANKYSAQQISKIK